MPKQAQRFFQKQQVTANTEVEVGRLPRKIDIACTILVNDWNRKS